MQTVRKVESLSNFKSMDVVRHLINGALYEKSPRNWTMTDRVNETRRERMREVGTVHATYTKQHLSQGHSVPFSSFESLERLQNGLSHWTPQLYMWGGKGNKGRVFNNLRAITCVGIEIDKSIHMQEVFYTAAKLELPSPSVVLRTPGSGGLQWFYVFDTPFYGSKKARKAGRFIAEEVKRAFVNELGADPGANPLGYFRFPTENNIEFFNGETVNSTFMLAWAKKAANKAKRPVVAKTSGDTQIYNQAEILEDPAVIALLEDKSIRGRKNEYGRNNAIFTIVLTLKYANKTEEEIYNVVDQWNSSLSAPLDHREVTRIVKSALQDKYKAPSKEIIEQLTGKKMKFRYRIITPAKKRLDRKNSHYHEWKEDIISYLEENCTSDQPYLYGSLRELGRVLGEASPVGKEINKDSLLAVLKSSKKFVLKSNGKRGCKARSYVTTRSILMKAQKASFKGFLATLDSSEDKTTWNTLEAQNEATTSLTLHNDGEHDDSGG